MWCKSKFAIKVCYFVNMPHHIFSLNFFVHIWLVGDQKNQKSKLTNLHLKSNPRNHLKLQYLSICRVLNFLPLYSKHMAKLTHSIFSTVVDSFCFFFWTENLNLNIYENVTPIVLRPWFVLLMFLFCFSFTCKLASLVTISSPRIGNSTFGSSEWSTWRLKSETCTVDGIFISFNEIFFES